MSGGILLPNSPVYAPTGITGATAASRYVGATTSGAPSSGTFVTGDFVIDQSGAAWVCSSGGSPGTWKELNSPIVASVSEYELTSTSLTAILSYTPGTDGNYRIGIYFRVITATTTITTTVTYTDSTGAQTLTLINTAGYATGSYALTDFTINAEADAISVKFTAGTANQVYASASILAG